LTTNGYGNDPGETMTPAQILLALDAINKKDDLDHMRRINENRLAQIVDEAFEKHMRQLHLKVTKKHGRARRDL
jgi:hypothetical protein